MQRLAKAIAASGVASRREAEKLIEAGRVEVNGQLVKTPAFNVNTRDEIKFDGRVLEKPALRVWLFHKPIGLVTTKRDEKGRKTIYDALPSALKNVNTVGRLDINSEGLLLLTNDGDLKRTLELPETGWRRSYRVRAYGKVGETGLDRLRAGVKIEGEQFRPMEIQFESEKGDNAWYRVSIREGKNREVRRAFEEIGLKVNRLIRVSYGPFQLGAMEKGEVSELRGRALSTLLGGLIPQGAELAKAPLDLSEEKETNTSKKAAQKKNENKTKPFAKKGQKSDFKSGARSLRNAKSGNSSRTSRNQNPSRKFSSTSKRGTKR